MINRRNFLKLVSGCAATLPLWPGVSRRFAHGDTLGATQDRPNVLLIILDDMNNWIGCFGGHPDVKTPNMDRLARRGVIFTNAQCAAPLCNPSRVSFFTGIRPSTSGVYKNEMPYRGVMPDVVTLPEHFMTHGYTAAGGGKLLHHDKVTDPVCWDESFLRTVGITRINPFPQSVPVCGIPDFQGIDWGPMPVDDTEIHDGKVARWGGSVLRRTHDKPFLLGVGFFMPHLPYYVPNKYLDMYPPESITLPPLKEDDLEDVPPQGAKWAVPHRIRKIREYGQWRNAVAGYLAGISFVDAQVGYVLDALDESPYLNNTVVVLWGDNGFHLGEKLHFGKSTLWEESARVPLIMAAPGITTPGGICTKPVSVMDVYPTLNELCGLTPKPELECRSILELLQNPQSSAWNGVPVLTTYGQGNHSLRDERYRYIRYSDGTEELYDHQADPHGWTNLANDSGHAAIKENLKRYLPRFDAPSAPAT
ncbi:MAG TPA: sulfatase [Syntrophobacter fumaroxidans]|nr:sulfatase [Syntrophobacter fumaroxidans]